MNVYKHVVIVVMGNASLQGTNSITLSVIHVTCIMSRWCALNLCDTKALSENFCMHHVLLIVEVVSRVHHWCCSL